MKKIVLTFAFCMAMPLMAAESAAYVLAPHDQVRVYALHVPEIPADAFRVDEEGYLNLPLVGRVAASGMTTTQLERALEAKLRNVVLEPEVTVNLVTARNQPVSVFGAVKNPGVHQLLERKRLIEVLSLAGGLREDAGSKVRITRALANGRLPLAGAADDSTGQFSVAEIDLASLMEARNPAENILVAPDDVVAVPVAEVVYVIGEVKRPGGFTLKDRETVHVLQALAMAEGMLATASSKNAKIVRSAKDETERVEIPVNLGKVMDGQAPDIGMQPGDILVVPNNIPRSVALRTAEAAVQLVTGVIIWRR
ncbi:MAG: polysaccharide biosynthesis/export family protein [Bryobacteraceae bacterium]